MNILILGNGGRDHALAWKAAQSPLVKKVFIAPGNAGTALETNISTASNLDHTNIEQVVQFALDNNISLCIPGPEAPLVLGITDALNRVNINCFGPTQQAAELEASKNFSKQFLERHNIPTAAYRTFTDFTEASTYLEQQIFPIVIKADGLAAGKGVIIASTLEEGNAALKDMLLNDTFGSSGKRVIIESFLTGEEASFICMVDGTDFIPLASSQDHKARDNGDQGPNTGGMGAYSPAPIVTDTLHQKIIDTIIKPTVEGLASEGIHYRGFLYAGLMISENEDIQVLEFNCRFGDPETQPILMRLTSDLIEHCNAAFTGNLSQQTLKWDPRPAVGVVLAAEGYPAKARKGDCINGLKTVNAIGAGTKVFHAGTAEKEGEIVTNGGRVLCVTALGETILDAQQKTYQAVKLINWEGYFYREDIAAKAINRQD